MEAFLDIYRNLNADNLERLGEIYAEEVRFIDPAHEINGLNFLMDYFKSLYRNIDPPQFCFTSHLRNGAEGYVQWEMDFSHPRLNSGRVITVDGVSYLKFNNSDMVYFHQDYFDLGAMLYEQIPLLGRIVTAIKRRLGQ